MKRAFTFLAFLALTPMAFSADNDKALAVSTASPSTNRAPGQLTTLFAADKAAAGNMFDIETFSTLDEITALDINWNTAGEVVQVEIYYKVGTCVGFDTDPSAWTLLSTGTGTAAGADLPTFIDILGNNVSFDAGELYALYVHVVNYPDLTGYLGYTKAASPQTYSNTDLSATCYYGTAHPAFSSIFTYGIWNGTIYYEIGLPPPLMVYPDEISSWTGDSTTFNLYGGPDMAHCMYGLFGTVSGTAPGTPLPGGLVLPINWDWLTETTLLLALVGSPATKDFIGTLDADGHAEATLWLPGHCQMFDDLLSNFAWCSVSPFDYVSPPVELLILGWTGGG